MTEKPGRHPRARFRVGITEGTDITNFYTYSQERTVTITGVDVDLGKTVVLFTGYIEDLIFGVKTVGKVDSVVSDIHITMRADSFSIPEEDAIDGQTSFVGNRQIGDSVHIVEREGCLGLR